MIWYKYIKIICKLANVFNNDEKIYFRLQIKNKNGFLNY